MNAAGVAAFFFDLIDAAEFEAGAAAGFGWWQPRRDELFYVQIRMEAEFGVEFVFDGVASKQGPQTDPDVVKHRALVMLFPTAGRRQRSASSIHLFRFQVVC